MLIAILSDIHGNLPALEAVLADIDALGPDEVWCGGDLAWAGPWPSQCIACVRDAGWPTIKGNTDVWITGDPQSVESASERAELEAFARAHDVSDDDAQWLLNLPLAHSGPGSVLLVHGTPETPFDAPLPDDGASAFTVYEGHASLVIYAHVHRAFARRLAGGTLVSNTGSVGAASDDPSACYLVIDVEGPELTFWHRRVAYDRDAAITRARQIGAPIGARFLSNIGAQ